MLLHWGDGPPPPSRRAPRSWCRPPDWTGLRAETCWEVVDVLPLGAAGVPDLIKSAAMAIGGGGGWGGGGLCLLLRTHPLLIRHQLRGRSFRAGASRPLITAANSSVKIPKRKLHIAGTKQTSGAESRRTGSSWRIITLCGFLLYFFLKTFPNYGTGAIKTILAWKANTKFDLDPSLLSLGLTSSSPSHCTIWVLVLAEQRSIWCLD